MRYRFIIILSLLLGVTSCDFGGRQEEVHIVGPYYVGWIDLESNRTIYIKETPESSYGQTIVSGYVFAVGNNAQYIIAKSLRDSKSTVDYHIIDTKGYYHTNMDNNNYWEFSSEAEFYRKLDTMGISTIQFDKNFRKNPW